MGKRITSGSEVQISDSGIGGRASWIKSRSAYIVAKYTVDLFVFVIFGNVRISSSVSSFLFVVFATELACCKPPPTFGAHLATARSRIFDRLTTRGSSNLASFESSRGKFVGDLETIAMWIITIVGL